MFDRVLQRITFGGMENRSNESLKNEVINCLSGVTALQARTVLEMASQTIDAVAVVQSSITLPQ